MKRKLGLALGLALLSSTALAGTAGSTYSVTNEVSNLKGAAANLDRGLVNGWGLAEFPGGPFWVSSADGNSEEVYDPKSFGKIAKVRVPGGGPTGVAYIVPKDDGTADFRITQHGITDRSFFVAATESGRILGWSRNVNANAMVTAVDNSGAGSSYKGLAFETRDRVLLAADFANGLIETFDNQFTQIGHFTDNNAPEGYAPFNVRVLKGRIYVAFAVRGGDGDEVKGAGLGFIDVFDFEGNLKQQLVAPGGVLNAPWGMTIAPAGFGDFAGKLLVGNFGDGKVNVFDPDTGAQLGTLSDSGGNPLVIDGLWGLLGGPGSRVTFAAGPNDEADGLVGTISLNGGGTVVRQTGSH